MIALTSKNTETASSVTSADSPTTELQVPAVAVDKAVASADPWVVVKANATTGPTMATANLVTSANSLMTVHPQVVDKEWVVQVVVVVLAVSSLKLATALMATLANSTTVVTQLLPTPTVEMAVAVDKANATISLRLAPVNSVTHADSLTRTKRRSCLCCNDMGDASCHAAGEMGLY